MGYERHSFSQAQGYEEIPGPLKLEELPKEARTRGGVARRPASGAAVAEGATGPGRLTRVECNAARRAKRGHK